MSECSCAGKTRSIEKSSDILYPAAIIIEISLRMELVSGEACLVDYYPTIKANWKARVTLRGTVLKFKRHLHLKFSIILQITIIIISSHFDPHILMSKWWFQNHFEHICNPNKENEENGRINNFANLSPEWQLSPLTLRYRNTPVTAPGEGTNRRINEWTRRSGRRESVRSFSSNVTAHIDSSPKCNESQRVAAACFNGLIETR